MIKESSSIVVIFFSKDRAMQLDAAIRSCRVYCKDLSSVKKFIIFKTSSKIHADQYKQLQCENQDFSFVEETQVVQQILNIASSFKFVSFHCDDNLYIRNFSFSKPIQILLENNLVLAHTFRLGPNIKYSYTKDSPEPQPTFYSLGQGILRFDWTKMKHRGFGYPLEVSASVYRCEDVIPLTLMHPACAVGNIESYLQNYRDRFFGISPFLTCNVLSSVISVPVNRVGVVSNKAGQKYSYSVEDLAFKFSEDLRINTDQFSNYIPEASHVELEFSFERRGER